MFATKPSPPGAWRIAFVGVFVFAAFLLRHLKNDPDAYFAPARMAHADFVLTDPLKKGKVEIASWPLCKVLLVDDKLYPWVLLVPQQNNIREIYDLSEADQLQLLKEINKASKAMNKAFKPLKLNVGYLGNICPQMHVHVVCRNEGDASWPNPVWGAVPSVPYGPGELEEVAEKIKAAFNEF
eukprot:jgi/Mesvir1/12657/Mv02208-RA.1